MEIITLMVNEFPLSDRAIRNGNGYMDFCPAHPNTNTPALSIAYKDGRLLLHCFAGCKFEDIISCVQRNGSRNYIPIYENRNLNRFPKNVLSNVNIFNIWNNSNPILKHSPIDIYLRDRNLSNYRLASDLRYHPKLYLNGNHYHALIAGVNYLGMITAIHRTFIHSNGKAVTYNNGKKYKKSWGKLKGGAIRLVNNNPSNLYVSEGIESALSYMKVHINYIGDKSIWAGISASNMMNLQLPSKAGNLHLIPDNDPTGLSASYHLMERASKLGWKTFEHCPQTKGYDWNDELIKKEYING